MPSLWTFPTLIPLALCSVIALTLLLERFFALSFLKKLPEKKSQKALKAAQTGQWGVVWEETLSSKTYLETALSNLKQNTDNSRALRDESISLEITLIANKLRKNFSGLTTIAVLAPMLGLLGTVAGLMEAFKDIGAIQGPIEPSIVANGLWQALITTAAGLIIAVICITFHSFYESKVSKLLRDGTHFLNKLSLQIELNKSQ